jgi:hypothetical protein
VQESRGVYRVSVGKPERRRSLGRPKRIWEQNIEIEASQRQRIEAAEMK